MPAISPARAALNHHDPSPLSDITTGLLFPSRDLTSATSFRRNFPSRQGHSPKGNSGFVLHLPGLQRRMIAIADHRGFQHRQHRRLLAFFVQSFRPLREMALRATAAFSSRSPAPLLAPARAASSICRSRSEKSYSPGRGASKSQCAAIRIFWRPNH